MLLAITRFEIDTNTNGDRYAYIEADVEILQQTYYSEPMFVPQACVASVLLSDDDANDYSQPEEQAELAEDVTDWEVDTTQYL